MQTLRINESVMTTSFTKRKSLKGTSTVLDDLPQNDDEAERKQRKRDSGVFANLATKRVSLGGIADLTTSELVAQYANCMRLSAENKINHKNAFNLPLIDCMKLLLKNKDEQMENFQVVGCTLDASAKIYASRVDRVHMDGISFAKGLGSRSKDLPASQMECSDNELGEENKMTEKKKKRGKKMPKLSRDVSKINLPSNVVVQDPTFVVLSKQFSNCQPSFISFFPKLKLVGDNCKVLMDMNAPFLADSIENGYGEERVPFECNIDENPEIVSLPFKNILSRDLDDTEYNSLLSTSVLEDSFNVRDDGDNFNDMPDDPIDDETVGNGLLEAYSDGKNSTWKVGSEMELGTTRVGCAARNGHREKLIDVQEAILKHVKEGSNLDYLYTNLDRMLWAGPTHWHSLPCTKVRDKNAAVSGNLKRKGKKITKMDFFNAEPVKLIPLRNVVLTSQYLDNKWSSEQVTNPPDLHIDIKILTRYFLRPKCGFTFTSGETAAPPEDDDDGHDYDYDNLNDSQHFCPAASPGPTSDGDNSANKDLPGLEGVSEPAADVHSFETASGDAWCMVDPPTKVARIQVPYAQHAKKIDMKVLKSAIWTVLTEDSSDSIGDAELTPRKKMKNDKVNSKVDTALMKKEIKFSALEQKVLKIVPSEMAQELSMPLVFTALLHLANERVLSLRGLEDHSDIFISQDRGADSFVKRLQERQFV